MINLFKVGMANDVTEALEKVIFSGYIGQGEIVDDFEQQLKNELGLEVTPVTVNSATSAIDLALEIIGVGPDDEVISTPQTCFASNVHIIHRHAKIRWADIDPISGLIDPNSVKRLVTKKTKAIIAVNWGGKFADYKKLKSFGIPVIEDAAHNWDTFLKTKVTRGDYIVYSFQAIKFLTTGDGGILVTPSKNESEARILRWYGLDRSKKESFRCTEDIKKVGFKYHMNNINASIGIKNIKFANESVKISRANSLYYINHIKNEMVIVPTWDEKSSYWLMSIHIKNNLKNKFMNYLLENGIESSPVHFRNDYYSSTLHFVEDSLPGVDSFTDSQVCIPNGFWVSKEKLEFIVETINKFS